MADAAERLLAKLATLNDSLDDLEERLEPLLAQTLPESLLPLETIQQVKLNVALPYLVYDLIFIYLKTRGIDPKSHPVVAELDRVRQYFDKIKNAEDPEKRKTAIDRAAANRFIKHAIAQAKGQPQQRTPGEAPAQSDGAPAHTHIRFDENGNAPSGSSSASTSSSTPVTQIPVKVTSKMLARAEYQKKLAEGDASSDGDDADGLAVIDGESESEGEAQSERMSLKAKGKAKATNKEGASPSGAKKRRRPASDPFAGYGDDTESKPSKTSKKKKSSQESVSSADVAMAGDPDPPSGTNTSTSKSANKDKNAAKKAKKKAKKAS